MATEDLLIKALLEDRKKDRFWRVMRSLVWALVLVILVTSIHAPGDLSASARPAGPYVALVRLQGPIMDGQRFSVQHVVPQLKAAFSDERAKGVVLEINSPGGTPVQASIIHDEILALKKETGKKVVVVAQDALTSGAYLVATAADAIYVNKDTITGSIGVIMNGFGFADAMKRLGISRRTFASGNSKSRLDPFSPLKQTDVKKIQLLLDQVHQHFIEYVQLGRKGRLKAKPKVLFSGDFWTGSTAVKLGLVDGEKNLWQVMESDFSVKDFRDFTYHSTFLETLSDESTLGIHVPGALLGVWPLAETLYGHLPG